MFPACISILSSPMCPTHLTSFSLRITTILNSIISIPFTTFVWLPYSTVKFRILLLNANTQYTLLSFFHSLRFYPGMSISIPPQWEGARLLSTLFMPLIPLKWGCIFNFNLGPSFSLPGFPLKPATYYKRVPTTLWQLWELSIFTTLHLEQPFCFIPALSQ